MNNNIVKLLGTAVVLVLMLGTVGALGEERIIINGEDVTNKYVDDTTTITGSLVVSASDLYWVDSYIKAYLPQITEGYNIYVTDAYGYPKVTYSFPTTASVGEPLEEPSTTGINANIVDIATTDDGFIVSTSGNGEGELLFTNINGMYYMITESGSDPVYGEIVDGSFTHSFTQSEHTFEFSVGDTSFEPPKPVYGSIMLNGEDITSKYVDDPTRLKGDLVILTNDYYMVDAWINAYFPQVEIGYNIFVRSYYGYSSVTYSFKTSAGVA